MQGQAGGRYNYGRYDLLGLAGLDWLAKQSTLCAVQLPACMLQAQEIQFGVLNVNMAQTSVSHSFHARRNGQSMLSSHLRVRCRIERVAMPKELP